MNLPFFYFNPIKALAMKVLTNTVFKHFFQKHIAAVTMPIFISVSQLFSSWLSTISIKDIFNLIRKLINLLLTILNELIDLLKKLSAKIFFKLKSLILKLLMKLNNILRHLILRIKSILAYLKILVHKIIKLIKFKLLNYQ